jgi:hypothetical protein
MIVSTDDSLSSISLLSLGFREKKAISDAEIIAEMHKNNPEIKRATIELNEIGEN